MTVFNFSRWAAKRVTSKKNVDIKIFIVGPAGSGKSMTGIALAKRVAKWLSYILNGDYDHISDYYEFDGDHIAVISPRDLIHVMSKRLKKHSVKVIDDCGASKGFTNRRSMSEANLDIVSIYGTNRTQNGVLIICVQDVDFADIRMRMLADVVIDLTDYTEEGPFRMAKLYKISKDKKVKGGIRKRRFMTYEHSAWVTFESIACFMPSPTEKIPYDELREAKEAENTEAIGAKYDALEAAELAQSTLPSCVFCRSSQLYYSKRDRSTSCRKCGREQPRDESAPEPKRKSRKRKVV